MIGLFLLAVVLLAPFLAVRRARRTSVFPAATGAYVAFLVHAGVDWDFELAGVTVVGLVAGAALVGQTTTPSRGSRS